jgi:ribosomal protein L34E
MCRQAKKLACWLEIRSDLRQDVQLVPDDPGMRAFAWGQPGVRATPDQLAGDARIVDVVAKLRPLTPADLPVSVPAEWRLEHGPSMQARVEPGERVRSQTFTFLAVPSASVAYSVLGEDHVVVLEGNRMLAPPAGGPFLRRARMLGRVKLALAALPVAAAVLYAARGEYFTSGRAAGLVAGVVVAAVAAAVLAYGVLWRATLGRCARTWAAATIAPAALAVVMAAIAEPRMARARDLIAAGELDEAAAELRALGRPAGDEVWADLHLRRSLAAATCADATARLHDIGTGLPQRARAQAHADELALSEAGAAIRARAAGVASTALGCGSEALRTTAAARAIRAQIADLEARRCGQIKDWACALDRSASASEPEALRSDILAAIRGEADAHVAAAARAPQLEQRVDEERAALALWQTYLLDARDAATPPGPVVELRAALARHQPALATEQRIAQARAEADARRAAAAAERERKQAELAAERDRKQAERAAERERRRQAAEEERANRPSGGLLCNDGTLSPTCTCGGSHRGCCSWHGGVAGCQ